MKAATLLPKNDEAIEAPMVSSVRHPLFSLLWFWFELDSPSPPPGGLLADPYMQSVATHHAHAHAHEHDPILFYLILSYPSFAFLFSSPFFFPFPSVHFFTTFPPFAILSFLPLPFFLSSYKTSMTYVPRY